jgi:hypothetical protein
VLHHLSSKDRFKRLNLLARRLLRVLLKRVGGVGAQARLLVVRCLLGLLLAALVVGVAGLGALLCVGLALGLGGLAALLGGSHFDVWHVLD